MHVQAKRVNIAVSIITDPLVLYLDEPTSGLVSADCCRPPAAAAGKVHDSLWQRPSLSMLPLLTLQDSFTSDEIMAYVHKVGSRRCPSAPSSTIMVENDPAVGTKA